MLFCVAMLFLWFMPKHGEHLLLIAKLYCCFATAQGMCKQVHLPLLISVLRHAEATAFYQLPHSCPLCLVMGTRGTIYNYQLLLLAGRWEVTIHVDTHFICTVNLIGWTLTIQTTKSKTGNSKLMPVKSMRRKMGDMFCGQNR